MIQIFVSVCCHSQYKHADIIVERTKFRSTLLPKPATLLPKTATMSKKHSNLSKRRNFTINSFDAVAVCSNKVECCFDNVAGVNGAWLPPWLGGRKRFSQEHFFIITTHFLMIFHSSSNSNILNSTQVLGSI